MRLATTFQLKKNLIKEKEHENNSKRNHKNSQRD